MKDYFKQLTIELTNKCNYRCIMCPRYHSNMEEGFIKDKLFYKILEEIKNEDIDVIPFFRGESILHKNFIKYLYEIKKSIRGKILLATNASLLTRDISDKLLDINIDFISFSLDAYNEKTYKKIRNADNYKNVLENIFYFIEKKERLKSKTTVQISAVELKENIKEEKKFVDFWIDKVDRIRIYLEHTVEGKFGKTNQKIKKESRKKCIKVFNNIVVCWDGKIALCNHDWNPKYITQNANDYSLYEIWNSDEYKKIRNMHINNTISQGIVCYDCDHWKENYDESIKGKLYLKK